MIAFTFDKSDSFTHAYIILRDEVDKQQPAQLQTQSHRARRAAVGQFYRFNFSFNNYDLKGDNTLESK